MGSTLTSGNGNSMSVMLMPTTSNDVIVVANTDVHDAAGPERQLAVDRTVTMPGTYSASATQNNFGGWVMEIVAFKLAN